MLGYNMEDVRLTNLIQSRYHKHNLSFGGRNEKSFY